MKFLVALCLGLAVVAVTAEPPAEYGAPSSGYGAPSGGYGGGGHSSGGGGGWGNDDGGHGGGHSSGGGGGWGQEASSGGGWGSGSSSSGFLDALRALKPRFRYVNVRIPIPILPRIRLGLKGKINAHASIQQAPQQQQGWGGW